MRDERQELAKAFSFDANKVSIFFAQAWYKGGNYGLGAWPCRSFPENRLLCPPAVMREPML
jgi:hypothetical protein